MSPMPSFNSPRHAAQWLKAQGYVVDMVKKTYQGGLPISHGSQVNLARRTLIRAGWEVNWRYPKNGLYGSIQ